MSATHPRVIGRPAARLSRAREIAFRKAVRDVLAERGGNGRGHSEVRIGRAERCCPQSLAEHLKPFSVSRIRQVRARVKR
jgi:hypothetical protein